MSLFRQLWLTVIVSMVLAFGGSFTVSMLTARSYLEQQLTSKNQDNAASLALSMSQQEQDAVTVELMVSALFDTGHYQLIRVADPHGKVMVERIATNGVKDVPAWFAHLFPIRAEAGQAQISQGWKQFGSVQLQSQNRFAYQALWHGGKRMLGWFVFAALVSGVLGSLVLRRLRRPVAQVVAQAHAIAERRFITIDEPKVPELRQLAGAMNGMVQRLENLFREEAARLDAIRREVNQDALTGLANRSHFMSQLQSALRAEDAAPNGVVLLLRVARLAEINRRLGRAAADELLRGVASLVQRETARYPDAFCGRLNGADFVLMIPAEEDGSALASALLGGMRDLATGYKEIDPVVWIGGSPYRRKADLQALLATCDAALATAEAHGGNAWHLAKLADAAPPAVTAANWTAVIRSALGAGQVRLMSFPVLARNRALMHLECPVRLRATEDQDWMPAGSFMPMAARLQLAAEIDLAVARLAYEKLASSSDEIAINLSGESIKDARFRERLVSLANEHAAENPRLWIDISEHGAFDHFEAFAELCGQLKAVRCRIGIEHFGRQIGAMGKLHGLGLDYLKVDASLVHGVDGNPGNQAFLKGLCAIARNMGLQTIAEGVMTEAEFTTVLELGFDGATGPAVSRDFEQRG